MTPPTVSAVTSTATLVPLTVSDSDIEDIDCDGIGEESSEDDAEDISSYASPNPLQDEAW